MKNDIKEFNELPMIKGNFNTSTAANAMGDPFLVKMSLHGKVLAQGNDIRSIKQAKNVRQGKRVL